MTAYSRDYHHCCRSVLDQLQQMRSMISTFLGACQDPTPSPRQSFCNYLHSDIERLEERDFLTFRNETVKLFSEIQYKAKESQVNRSPHFNFQKQHRPQQDVNTHSPYQKLKQSSFLAYTDSHITACYNDCQSTATIKAFISVSTANFLCSCG